MKLRLHEARFRGALQEGLKGETGCGTLAA